MPSQLECPYQAERLIGQLFERKISTPDTARVLKETVPSDVCAAAGDPEAGRLRRAARELHSAVAGLQARLRGHQRGVLVGQRLPAPGGYPDNCVKQAIGSAKFSQLRRKAPTRAITAFKKTLLKHYAKRK